MCNANCAQNKKCKSAKHTHRNISKSLDPMSFVGSIPDFTTQCDLAASAKQRSPSHGRSSSSQSRLLIAWAAAKHEPNVTTEPQCSVHGSQPQQTWMGPMSTPPKAMCLQLQELGVLHQNHPAQHVDGTHPLLVHSGHHQCTPPTLKEPLKSPKHCNTSRLGANASKLHVYARHFDWRIACKTTSRTEAPAWSFIPTGKDGPLSFES